MPDPIPGPAYTRPSTAPSVIDGTPGVGVHVRTVSELESTPKLSASDTFTTLDNFVTIYGEPAIASGMLSGDGVVRYKNQALTDHHRVSGVVGSKATGTTRLVLCGDVNLTRFYAVEIAVGGSTSLSIIKGSAASSVQEGNDLLALLFRLLLFVFTLFSQTTTKYATTTVTLNVADEVSVEYDPDDHTIRTYINDIPTACELEVPRGECPHGPGFRWGGVAQGIDSPAAGVKFTSFALEDV